MENDQKKLPIESFYRSRDEFTIIGLTGLAGSGCSTLASIMADPRFFEYEKEVRHPSQLKVDGVLREENLINTNQYHVPSLESAAIKSSAQLIFKRKYTICYNFLSQNYHAYTIVKYTHVLWLYVLLYISKKCKEEQQTLDGTRLVNNISDMLKDKFALSHDSKKDIDYKQKYGEKIDNIDFKNLLLTCGVDWDDLVKSINALSNDYLNEQMLVSVIKSELSQWFFEKNGSFVHFVQAISDVLAHIDYYCLCFFYHRLAGVIRKTGNPMDSSAKVHANKKDHDNSHVFDIVKLINILIKGLRKSKNGQDETVSVNPVRIVIDSLRNSLEATYLKERYNAFYLIAVHCDDGRSMFLKKKVKSIVNVSGKQVNGELKERINCIYDRVKNLTDIEVDNDDFEHGDFCSPNVGQCISDAEIHIVNTLRPDLEYPEFHSMSEQWLKYASLILHPGLITPSSEERCMVVAYTAKFNSGCLSRQVGAVITNHDHSIRTIGWNDVPYGQVPCALREIDDHSRNTEETRSYYTYMYSAFERNSGLLYRGKSFLDKIKYDYEETKTSLKNLKGLPYSYCFKSLHNRYEGKENQVHTRSLHAEENAMLQMVKYGGQPLKNGIICVTASPCELCCKKLYQIGVRKIVFIDPYPGISRQNIIGNGFKRPALKLFQGAYGPTYFKLYQPFMSYKDELSIRLTDSNSPAMISRKEAMRQIIEALDLDDVDRYKKEDIDELVKTIKKKKSEDNKQ